MRQAAAQESARLGEIPLPPRRRTKKRSNTPPPTPAIGLTQIIEGHLEADGRDHATKTWAPLISRSIARIIRARRIPTEAAIDWLYETEEPVNIFNFSDWARTR